MVSNPVPPRVLVIPVFNQGSTRVEIREGDQATLKTLTLSVFRLKSYPDTVQY